MIHYRVLMEPIGTNVFFLAPWARSVSGDYRHARRRSGRRGLRPRYPASHQPLRSGLRHFCSVPRPSCAAAGQIYPPQVAPMYLQRTAGRSIRAFPPGSADHKIRQPTISTRPPPSRIYLKTRFGYTLQLPRTPVNDPIANFLFERKQGHCEYFASSMAVMLRTLGIPSRVVNGFRSDEFNDLTGNYVVRAKDAHSWVEAYFPGYGWQTFDPTPAGASGTPQGWDRARALRRRHGFVLARLGGQLRHFSSILARPGRVQRHARPMGTRPRLGASALRCDAAVGPPQPGSRGTFAQALVRSRPGRWHRPAGGIAGTFKSAPDRALASRKVAARASRAILRNRPLPCGTNGWHAPWPAAE